MIAAAFLSSDADSGARGCEDTDFALRGVGSVASSADILLGYVKANCDSSSKVYV